MRIVWDRAGNPTRHVSDALGISQFQVRRAHHKINA